LGVVAQNENDPYCARRYGSESMLWLLRERGADFLVPIGSAGPATEVAAHFHAPQKGLDALLAHAGDFGKFVGTDVFVLAHFGKQLLVLVLVPVRAAQHYGEAGSREYAEYGIDVHNTLIPVAVSRGVTVKYNIILLMFCQWLERLDVGGVYSEHKSGCAMLRKVVKMLIPRGLFRAIEPYGHLLEAIMWNVVEGFPARGLKVIGITGTDGKTTTCTMVYTMLNDAGIKTGLMTTIGWGTPDDWRDNKVHMTTMQTRPMLKRIKALRARGIDWLVLETTSHALAQNRVWGIPYSVVAMTNITHEHLDYHGTFERYLQAKVKLFRLAAGNARGLRIGIVNADDPNGASFAAAAPSIIRYSVKQSQSDLKAVNVKSNATGNDYDVTYDGQKMHIRTNLPGSFNVYNSLAAVGVGLAVGLKPVQIEHGIATLQTVKGRMNSIDEGQDFGAIVDFAHTPQSFDKLLSSAKTMTRGKLIVLFGSAGRRDGVATATA